MLSRIFYILLIGSALVNVQYAQSPQVDGDEGGAIRRALNDWVAATNRGDKQASDTIWASKVIGWFPEAPEFGNRAAWSIAGLPEKKGRSIFNISDLHRRN